MIQPAKRIYLIDMLRGLMLVLMTLDHTSLFTKRITFQPFGFFGADMGFIFLSGFTFGFVYTNYLNDTKELIKRSFKRILIIYQYHIGIFLLIKLEYFVVSALQDKIPLIIALNEIVKEPINDLKFFFLLHQPGFLDILPLYISLIALSPFVLLAINKGHIWAVFVSSFLLWSVFQVPIIQISYAAIQSNLKIDLGYFSFYAWQFLFVLGLYLGYARNRKIVLIKYTRFRIISAIIISLLIMMVRQVGEYLDWKWVQMLINERAFLMAPRLLNFMLIVYVIGGISKYLVIEKRNYLAFLGQYSIDVFSFHVVIAYLLLKYNSKLVGMSHLLQLIFALGLCMLLIIPAIIGEEWKRRKRDTAKIYLPDYVNLLIGFPKDMYDIIAKSTGKFKIHER